MSLYNLQNDMIREGGTLGHTGFKAVYSLPKGSNQDAMEAARWIHEQAFDAIYYPQVRHGSGWCSGWRGCCVAGMLCGAVCGVAAPRPLLSAIL